MHADNLLKVLYDIFKQIWAIKMHKMWTYMLPLMHIKPKTTVIKHFKEKLIPLF